MTQQAQLQNDESDLMLSQDVLRNLTDGVYIVDRDRRILFWNQAAEDITGFLASEVVGSRCQDDILKHVNHQGCCLCRKTCPLSTVIKTGQPAQMHVFLNHRQGHRVPVHVRTTPVRDADGQIIACVEVFSDDTQRQSLMDRLAHLENQALLDPLTGLANREYFDTTLKASLNKHARYRVPFGLIIADIDHFKKFNDSHGNAAGDQILKLVALTLASNSRTYDTVARWDDGAFALIVELNDTQKLQQHAQQLCNLAAQSSLKQDHNDIGVTLSLGVTLVRKRDTIKSITQRACKLLNASKQAGRNCVSMG